MGRIGRVLGARLVVLAGIWAGLGEGWFDPPKADLRQLPPEADVSHHERVWGYMSGLRADGSIRQRRTYGKFLQRRIVRTMSGSWAVG